MDKVDINRLMRNLPDLLEHIAEGESFMITQSGREVAILSPVVTKPDLEPTDHVPDANHVSPLMRKIMRKNHG